jgi:hypothetical protein
MKGVVLTSGQHERAALASQATRARSLRGTNHDVSDRRKREMEQQLEQERWWPPPAGTISGSLVVRGDESPSEMRGAWAKWNRAVEHYNDLKDTAAECCGRPGPSSATSTLT